MRETDDRDELTESGLALVGEQAETSTLPQVPESIEEVLQVEEAPLPWTTDVGERSIVARLFRADAEPEEVPLAAVPALIEDDANFVWIDLSTYNEADLETVAGLLGFEAGIRHALLSPWRRPTLAVYGPYFLASATVARPDPGEYHIGAGQLDVIAGNNVLVSAHKQPLPFYARVLARVRHNPELVRGDSAYMLYILFDELLAYYEDLNRHLQVELEGLEERALHAASDEFLESMVRFRRYGFTLFRLADEHRAVFAAFLRPDFHRVSGREVEMYFRDLDGRLAHLLGVMLGLREAVNAAFQIYATHTATRTNEVIKVLTLVSAVLFSASVIIYLFGVNAAAAFHGMASPAGFAAMVALIALTAGGILAAFRRRGWM